MSQGAKVSPEQAVRYAPPLSRLAQSSWLAQVTAQQAQQVGLAADEYTLAGITEMGTEISGSGPMGSLSISVVERTRAIGVMRAVGAPSRTLMGIFVMEGILQGALSWLIALPLSLLVGQPVAALLGRVMFNMSLAYQYSWRAVGAWLLVILVISSLAYA